MKILLIYNLDSGNGRFMNCFGKIKTFFETNKFDYDVYPINQFDKVVDDISKCAPSYDVFVVAGGDGTIHSVINGVMHVDKENRPRLLFLPFGTSNDMANILGLNKNVDFNLSLLKTNYYRYCDIYAINDAFFVYAAAVGKFSNVSYNINRKWLKRLGTTGYVLNARRDLKNEYLMDVTIQTNRLTIQRRAFLIFIASYTRVGGFNIKKFGHTPKLNDGKIDIRIFTRNHILSWMKMIWFYIFKGRHFQNDVDIQTTDVKITLPNEYTWNTDGEVGPKGSVEVRTLKEQIAVYVHPKKIHKLFLNKED